MKHVPLIILFFLSTVFFSCADNKNGQLIIGHWSGVAWNVDGKPSGHHAARTFFQFDDKENYKFEYDGHMEKGTYKVENDMLFTRPDGEQEMMVKILKLTKDSLVFGMNRGGDAETLTLLRQ